MVWLIRENAEDEDGDKDIAGRQCLVAKASDANKRITDECHMQVGLLFWIEDHILIENWIEKSINSGSNCDH